MAQEHLTYACHTMYYVQAIQCPTSMAGPAGPQSGMLIAMSTAETTRIMKENWNQHEEGVGITDSYWHKMELWWIPGLVFLNFSGYGNQGYPGQRLRQNFREFLEEACMR